MRRVRVRWRGVGKVAVATALGLAALQALPGLLEPPQAPPLAADVGLPRVPVPREPAVEIREPKREPKRRRASGVSAATAVIGTTPRRRGPKRRDRRGAFLSHTERKAPALPPPSPPPAPEPPPYVPPPEAPPAPEAAPPPAPEPPPPPNDGSVEFAPH